ncbi:MAG: hypothetical protein JNL01_06200 [Bdellovibrionales bacterium]|nr:hypothetical protein [Bdellovibrionales bacterium]
MRVKWLSPAVPFLILLGFSGRTDARSTNVHIADQMKQEIEAQAEALRQLQNQFASVCMDSQGKLDPDLVVMDQESKTESLSCANEAKRLDDLGKQVEDKVAQWDQSYGNPDCAECGVVQPEDPSVLSQLSGDLDQEECKPNEKTEILSAKCAAEVSCSMLRSIAMPATLLANIIQPETKKLAGGCLDAEKGSCVSKLVEGVVANLVSTVKVIGNLAALGWNKLNSWIWDHEDQTSDKGLAATGLTDEQLDQAETDQPGFFKGLFDGIYKGIEDGIKGGFACEDWQGFPYHSLCLKPMKSWDCSTCDQKISAICGVAGYLGAEVVTAFFTGGATAVTKTVATTTLKAVAITAKAAGKGASVLAKVSGVSKVVSPLAKPLVSLGSKSAKGISYGARVARLAFIKGTRSVTRSQVANSLKVGLSKMKTTAARGGSFVAQFKDKGTLQVIKKLGKTLATPVTAYFGMLKKAFSLGFSKTDSAIARATSKVHFYAQAGTKANVGEKVIQQVDLTRGCK